MVERRKQLQSGRSPEDTIRWLGPLPIWARPSPAGLRLHGNHHSGRPALLRFANDDFMEEFISTLTTEPQRLGEWQAQPETWRRPMTSPRQEKPESPEVSKIAFIYDKTHNLTKARKSLLPTAINLQPLKKLFRKETKPTTTVPDEEQLPLKLYQVSQNRHYLVSASLIVDEPGMPDCVPDLSRKEKVSFVIRRLIPNENSLVVDRKGVSMDQWDEYAFVPGENGKAGNSWRRIGVHNSGGCRKLIAGEEQLPMFPVSFSGSCGDPRRLLSGVIPVSRREQWVGTSVGADVGSNIEPGTVESTAERLFQADVVAPWYVLLEQAESKKNAADVDFTNFGTNDSAKKAERNRLLQTSRDEIQTGSWYVLLDFARFLEHHLPSLWRVLKGETGPEVLDNGEQQLLKVLQNTRLPWQLVYSLIRGKDMTPPLADDEEALQEVLQYLSLAPGSLMEEPPDSLAFAQAATVPASGAPYRYEQVEWSLAGALVAALAADKGLETVDSTLIRFAENGLPLAVDSNWPDFLFPLADPDYGMLQPAVAAAELSGLTGVERQQAAVDVLARMVSALLPADQSNGGTPLIDSVPVGDPRDVWFVVRCVYERPNCGPLFTTLLSGPTAQFQMAPFFDPDAPVRPVRIPMPLDITPAGLRKYQKNTGFVISDMLCGKIKGIRKMTFADLVLSVLPWPFHKDLSNPGGEKCEKGGNSFGMICSLSIPIVTLCALILMMIMVGLFDLIFRWIPYLFVCLPIPGLKGKKK